MVIRACCIPRCRVGKRPSGRHVAALHLFIASTPCRITSWHPDADGCYVKPMLLVNRRRCPGAGMAVSLAILCSAPRRSCLHVSLRSHGVTRRMCHATFAERHENLTARKCLRLAVSRKRPDLSWLGLSSLSLAVTWDSSQVYNKSHLCGGRDQAWKRTEGDLSDTPTLLQACTRPGCHALDTGPGQMESL